MSWKAVDRYSQDYIELQTKDKVKFYKTPDAILRAQLAAWDKVVAKKAEREPDVQEGARLAEGLRRARRAAGRSTTNVDFTHGLQPLLRRSRPPRRPDAAPAEA